LRLQLPVCCPELPSHVTLADLTLTNRPRISETKNKNKKGETVRNYQKKVERCSKSCPCLLKRAELG
jgi:hypothetical protein